MIRNVASVDQWQVVQKWAAEVSLEVTALYCAGAGAETLAIVGASSTPRDVRVILAGIIAYAPLFVHAWLGNVAQPVQVIALPRARVMLKSRLWNEYTLSSPNTACVGYGYRLHQMRASRARVGR